MENLKLLFSESNESVSRSIEVNTFMKVLLNLVINDIQFI